MTTEQTAEEMDARGVARSIILQLMDTVLAAHGIPSTTYTLPPAGVKEAYDDAQDAIAHLLETRELELTTAYNDSMTAVGELHTQQIENWEGEVKELETRLADLEGLPAILEAAGKTANGYLENGEAWRKNAGEWKTAAQEAEKEADRLREDLMGLTVENAELRGYKSRVTEFDPISDREQLDRSERPPMRYSQHDSMSDVAAMMYRDKDRPTPWYRRRPV